MVSALLNAISFFLNYLKVGSVFGNSTDANNDSSTDTGTDTSTDGVTDAADHFTFVHHLLLLLLQRLTIFTSMTLSFMRTVTILVPFRKVARNKVYLACGMYGLVTLVLQLFGSWSKVRVATNLYILAPDNTSFLYIFYVMPFLAASLVILASTLIASWKLTMRRSRYSNQERENRVRREMTATIRLTGFIFLLCNVGCPVFLTCLSVSSVSLTQTLQSRPGFYLAAYILGNGTGYLDAALTPIILSVRGSQLKRVHKEIIHRALKRISTRRALSREPDHRTLQFLAASSMQLSSLCQEALGPGIRNQSRNLLRGRKQLPTLTEQLSDT